MAPLVKLVLASPIAAATRGEREIEFAFEGTLGQLLDEVADRYGTGFRTRIFEADGGLKRFVNIYVNGEDTRYLKGLATLVPGDATVDLLPAVAGG